MADLLKREVSKIIEEDLKDPQIGFVTITGMKVTDDLRLAEVLVSVLGDEEARKRSLEALTRARGYVRRLIGQRVRLRFTPEIRFRFDNIPPFISTEGIDGEKP